MLTCVYIYIHTYNCTHMYISNIYIYIYNPYPLAGGAENCNITIFEVKGVKNVILHF